MSEGWAPQDLEEVDHCPVCEAADHHLLYEDLVDQVYRIAGGRWTMRRCDRCGAAFLSPRPAEHALARAYGEGYYTHGPPESPDAPSGLRGWIVGGRNALLGRTHGLRLQPRRPSAMPIVALNPRARAAAHRLFRHVALPAPGARLLDVGCGNGSFVRLALAAGWDASGIDTDPQAIGAGRAAGLPVRVAALEQVAAEEAGGFAALTASHVLEHVPRPVAFLRAARTALAPGGRLWIATPNLDSPAHRRFGRHWLHLDPPRHLVVFTAEALELALRKAGFSTVRRIASASGTVEAYGHSEQIASGRPVSAPARPGAAGAVASALQGLRALRDPGSSEELIVIAS